MRETKLLTRSEFQVMSILWNLPGQEGFTGDILEKFEDPKPAYTTLATFLKILGSKGFVKFKRRGNKLLFSPKVSKEKYASTYLDPAKDAFFAGNLKDMISYLIDSDALSAEDIAGLIEQLQQKQQ